MVSQGLIPIHLRFGIGWGYLNNKFTVYLEVIKRIFFLLLENGSHVRRV